MRKTTPAKFSESHALAFFARHLDTLNWNYHYSDDQQRIFCGFNSPELLWDFAMSARELQPGVFALFVNSYIPTKAPPDRRAACVELLNRINYKLLLGCFEMNLEEGHICFRTSTVIPLLDLSPGVCEHLLRSNLGGVEAHFREECFLPMQDRRIVIIRVISVPRLARHQINRHRMAQGRWGSSMNSGYRGMTASAHRSET